MHRYCEYVKTVCRMRVDVFRKMAEYFRRKFKINNWNWPELNTYCGCCELSTGIYIRCIISLITMALMIAVNGFSLSEILETRTVLEEINVTDIGDIYNETITESDLNTVKKVFSALKLYLILWMTLKFFYVLTTFTTFYAIAFNKPKLLRFIFYTMISNWVFDMLILIGAKCVISLHVQLIFLFIIGTEFYNLIAINSQYKQMSLKSRIVPEDALTIDVGSNTPQSPNASNEYQLPHCRTCNCSTIIEIRSERTISTALNSPQTPISNNEADEEKVINFKDGPIIFNQDQLESPNTLFAENTVSAGSSVAPRRPRPVRPNSLDL